MYVVAVIPQLDVQEKGKVSEKEFSDVSDHYNNIMVHAHVYVQCHSIHAYMYVPNIHVRFVPSIGLFQILPGIPEATTCRFCRYSNPTTIRPTFRWPLLNT